MAKTFKTPSLAHQKAKKKAEPKAKEPEREGNRYQRAARVIAKMGDPIDVRELADNAFMSESTAARCLEAWHAVIAALIVVGRLTDPEAPKKEAPPKTKPGPVAEPAPTEKTAATPPAVEPVGTAEAI